MRSVSKSSGALDIYIQFRLNMNSNFWLLEEAVQHQVPLRIVPTYTCYNQTLTWKYFTGPSGQLLKEAQTIPLARFFHEIDDRCAPPAVLLCHPRGESVLTRRTWRRVKAEPWRNQVHSLQHLSDSRVLKLKAWTSDGVLQSELRRGLAQEAGGQLLSDSQLINKSVELLRTITRIVHLQRLRSVQSVAFDMVLDMDGSPRLVLLKHLEVAKLTLPRSIDQKPTALSSDSEVLSEEDLGPQEKQGSQWHPDFIELVMKTFEKQRTSQSIRRIACERVKLPPPQRKYLQEQRNFWERSLKKYTNNVESLKDVLEYMDKSRKVDNPQRRAKLSVSRLLGNSLKHREQTASYSQPRLSRRPLLSMLSSEYSRLHKKYIHESPVGVWKEEDALKSFKPRLIR